MWRCWPAVGWPSCPQAVTCACASTAPVRAPTRIALFADDEKVAEAQDRDRLRYGSVGMLVSAEEPPADVLFEDFVLLGHRRQV